MSQGAPSPTLRAALFMLGAILSFSLMAIAGREVAGQLDTFELMTYRSAIGLIIVLALGAGLGRLSEIRANRLGLHGLRNLVHFTGQNLWFWALTMIPLAQVFALEFTSPLWVMVLAALMLGERLTWIKGLAGVLGFFGVLMVVRPGAVPLSWGMAAAALAAIFFALTAIATKRLTRDQSILCILFWLTLMQLGFGLIMCLYDGQMRLPQGTAILWVVVVAICGLLAHFSITSALVLAPASVVMPMDFVRLPVIALLGMALYGEGFDWWVFAGAALIFGANYINILAQSGRPAPSRSDRA